ncbi:unnamed protein product, partial [Phaeothamnion confervicola]
MENARPAKAPKRRRGANSSTPAAIPDSPRSAEKGKRRRVAPGASSSHGGAAAGDAVPDAMEIEKSEVAILRGESPDPNSENDGAAAAAPTTSARSASSNGTSAGESAGYPARGPPENGGGFTPGASHGQGRGPVNPCACPLVGMPISELTAASGRQSGRAAPAAPLRIERPASGGGGGGGGGSSGGNSGRGCASVFSNRGGAASGGVGRQAFGATTAATGTAGGAAATSGAAATAGAGGSPRQPDDEFKCPICWEMLARPVTLMCGHTACEVCVAQHFKTQIHRAAAGPFGGGGAAAGAGAGNAAAGGGAAADAVNG